MSRKRVVLVCMVDSIHVARWIAQFEPNEVEFTLFPSTPNRRVHAMIKDMMAKNGNIKIVPFGGKLSIPLWGMDLVFSDYVRGWLLRGILKRTKPDFVHALELQHGGYITSRALQDASVKTQFIATNYGSDIFWFQQFPKHLAKIRKLLARADRYSAECNRDVDLAKKHGFSGEVMPVFPNAGGFPSSYFEEALSPRNNRRRITLKGYEGWSGMALTVVEALEDNKDLLRGKVITIVSASRSTRRAARMLRKKYDLEVEVFAKNSLSHSQTLEIMKNSSVFIGLSRTDGLSTSTMEAIICGAYPIQSATACIFERLHREGYFQIIRENTRQNAAEALRRGIEHTLNESSLEEMNAARLEIKSFALDSQVRLKARQLYSPSGISRS